MKKPPQKRGYNMALAFGQAKGKAQKNTILQYEYKNGDQKVRLVGGILPRYVYWIKGKNNKSIPFECLAFDRTTESFNNKERDYVQEYYPDLKCGWAYAIQCIDPADGQVKVLNLKKKLLEQIMVAAEDLGDPTDPETGWWVNFKRVKTGSQAYNVEYQLQPLKCKPEPLTAAEREAVENAKPIDELLVRPTPEAQKALLDQIRAMNEAGAEMDETVEEEFDIA
jgi:hypothetical protein